MGKQSNTLSTHTNLVMVILIEAVIYCALWLWDEYVASYLTLIFPGLILAVLIIAVLADLIEPARIPRWYYGLMIVSILTPLLIGTLFYFIYEGQLEWLR